MSCTSSPAVCRAAHMVTCSLFDVRSLTAVGCCNKLNASLPSGCAIHLRLVLGLKCESARRTVTVKVSRCLLLQAQLERGHMAKLRRY